MLARACLGKCSVFSIQIKRYWYRKKKFPPHPVKVAGSGRLVPAELRAEAAAQGSLVRKEGQRLA